MDESELQKLLESTDTNSQTKLNTWMPKKLSPLYATDGSGHPLQGEEPYIFKGKSTYRKRSTHMVVVQNLLTRSIRGLFYPALTGQSRRDIREFIRALPLGAKLLADREFDVEYLQAEASSYQIDLQARPNLRDGKPASSPLRREAHQKFDAKTYRLRKIHEAIFSILRARGVLVPRRATVSLAAKAALWACVGHNLDCLLNLDLAARIFHWVDFSIHTPLPEVSSLTLNQELTFPKVREEASSTCLTGCQGVSLSELKDISPLIGSSDFPYEFEVTAVIQQESPPRSPQSGGLPSNAALDSSSSPSLVIPRSLLGDGIARLVLVLLIQCYPQLQDRTKIYKALGLPRSTVYDGIQRLMQNGMVVQKFQPTGGRGRPRTLYSLCFPASDRGPPTR